MDVRSAFSVSSQHMVNTNAKELAFNAKDLTFEAKAN